MRFLLDEVSANVMTHQGTGIFAARLVTYNRSHQIEWDAHFRQHCRNRPTQIVRAELIDR